MQHIQSTVTDLPSSCKSAADHMAQVLAEEDQYADLNERCRQKILELEDTLTGSDSARETAGLSAPSAAPTALHPFPLNLQSRIPFPFHF